MEEHIIIFIIALVTEIIGTVSGFGSSMLFVPLVGLVLPRPHVLGVTSLLHVFSNTVKVLMFRKHIDWRIALKFGIPSLLLVIVGAFLAGSINDSWAQISLGLFLLLVSGLFFFFPQIKLKPTNASAIATGGVAGFVAGMLGTGGAIRGAGLAAFGLSSSAFVGTSAAIDFGVDFSRMFIYISEGFMPLGILAMVPALLIASVLGTWIGKKILDRISQKVFRKIVLAMIFLMGVVLVVKQMM
ncbi:MAG: sulfite exporter TauE/SafE family protein [Flavobacteriales bacterium]|nr:sulfite exporter TauE/SafE family protein [Flavobacteriales bacterium]